MYSHIQYGIEIYANCQKTNLKQIQIMQDRFLRILFHKNSTRELEQIYKSMNILKCMQIYTLKILLLAYNKKNNKGPMAIMK